MDEKSSRPQPTAVDRYAPRRSAMPTEHEGSREERPATEYEAHSLVSANRRAEIMLELRFKTGDSVALPYAYVTEIRFDRSIGIAIRFTGDRKVQLTGRNLAPLYHALTKHQVTWLAEYDQMRALALPKDKTVVESIVIEDT